MNNIFEISDDNNCDFEKQVVNLLDYTLYDPFSMEKFFNDFNINGIAKSCYYDFINSNDEDKKILFVKEIIFELFDNNDTEKLKRLTLDDTNIYGLALVFYIYNEKFTFSKQQLIMILENYDFWIYEMPDEKFSCKRIYGIIMDDDYFNVLLKNKYKLLYFLMSIDALDSKKHIYNIISKLKSDYNLNENIFKWIGYIYKYDYLKHHDDEKVINYILKYPYYVEFFELKNNIKFKGLFK